MENPFQFGRELGITDLVDSEEELDEVVRTVRRYDPFYTQLWNSLTPIQQQTLGMVIAEGGVNLQSQKVIKAMGKGPSTIKRAVEAMVSRDVPRGEESLGSIRFRFEDPFFAQWIAKFVARA